MIRTIIDYLNVNRVLALLMAFLMAGGIASMINKNFIIKYFGSKDTTRETFKYSLIEEGEIWMDMIKSRNNTSHTYNEETANEIAEAIINDYYNEFEKLNEKLAALKIKEQK